jgi:hypothetical protein
MQTLLKPEILSKEVKKNLNTTTAAAIAVVNAPKTNLDDTHPPNILESVREVNKASPLLKKFRK